MELAGNGQEALDLLRSMKTLPNLILLDLMMPVMDGWQCLKELSKDPKLVNIPVIICSAAIHDLPVDRPILGKPVSQKTLIKTAAEFCKAARY